MFFEVMGHNLLQILFQELCKRVNILVDHNEKRKLDVKTWMLNTVLVVGFIQKVLGLDKSKYGDLFSEESIHRAIGLLRTNSVKLDAPPGYTTGSAMYPTFSLLNHNCVCNTRTRKFRDQYGNNIIELEAMMPIKKVEEICTRFVKKYLFVLNINAKIFKGRGKQDGHMC